MYLSSSIMMFSRIITNRIYSLKVLISAILLTVSVIFFTSHSLYIGSTSARKSAQNCICAQDSAPNLAAGAATIISSAPAPASTGIPEKLWYKLGPKGLSDDSQHWVESCLMKNPTYQFEFMTDATSNIYVKKYFSHRPDIIETYLNIPIPILKADILRYLILYNDGGIWSDLDVSCGEILINDWIPKQYKEKTNLVVGLEFDWAWENDDFLHSQFASWTLMSKPRSPHLLMVIDDILEDIRQTLKAHNITLPNLKMDMVGEVVDITGPKRMTRGIVKSLELMVKDTIDDRNISGLLKPKLIGDVLILPGNSFAASQSGDPKNQGPVLVTHHYAGSWKNDKGGETRGAVKVLDKMVIDFVK